MSLQSPDRMETEWNVGTVIWLIALAVGCISGVWLTSHALHLPLLIAFMIALPTGWILAASVITRLSAKDIVFGLPELPDELYALSVFRARLTLVNTKPTLPSLFVTTTFLIETTGYRLNAARRFVAMLGPSQDIDCAWDITVRRRGPLQLGPFEALVEFPGSLFKIRVECNHTRTTLVFPALYRLTPQVMELLTGRRQAAGRRQLLPVAMAEFAGVRDYRPGDNPRLIHWGLSLRASDYPYELVVREFEDPTDDDVCVILDCAVPDDDPLHDVLLWRLEKAISFVAALCSMLVERKYRVRFLSTTPHGRQLDLRLGARRQDIQLLNSVLAGLEPIKDRAPVRVMLDQESRRSSSAIVFVSLRETAEEHLHPRLSVLTITPDWIPSLTHEVVTL